MHILGLCNGSIHGNSEILLKAALLAAVEHDSSISTSWIHVPSVVIPRNAKPLRVEPDIIPNRSHEYTSNNGSDTGSGCQKADIDDREAVFEAIMDADALIIATPIYSHQPAGSLKALQDAILGPFADTSNHHRTYQRQRAGDAAVKEVVVDPRAIKPRVAAFIAVAGSRGQFPEQWTLAMPSLHQFTYPLHCKVVDMFVFPGFAHAGAVLTDREAMTRASKIGANVASQIGRPFDDAEYLGPKEDGSCPYCNLLKFEFQGADNRIRCITCGAAGELKTRADGRVRPIWDEDSDLSCITLKGKWQHVDDIAEGLSIERKELPMVATELERWRAVELPIVVLPSQQSHKAQLGKTASR
jgi:multimeric flavodoxin WrbA